MHGYFCILKNWYFCSSSYLLILISSLKLQFFCNHFLTKPYRLRTGHRHHQLLNSPYTAPSGSIVATCQCDDIAERCGVTTDQPWFFDSSMCLNLGIQPSKWPLEGPRDEKWIYFGSHFVDIPIDGDVSVFNKIVLPPWRAKVERAKCAGRLIFPWLLDVPTHATHCKSALAGLSTQSQHQHEAGCVNYYWCWECLHVITSCNHRRYRSHRTVVFSTCYFLELYPSNFDDFEPRWKWTWTTSQITPAGQTPHSWKKWMLITPIGKRKSICTASISMCIYIYHVYIYNV